MSRRVLVAAIAVLVALTGTVAVFAYARGADRRALVGQEAVSAYVARKDVPAGTTAAKAVADGLIVKELIARKGVPEGALTDVSGSYEQLVATSTLQPGELVLRSRFGTQAAVDGRLLVPEGRLAVSVTLDDPSHVGPFLAVGSHIAVFDTFNVLGSDKQGATPAGDHLTDRHEYLRATRLLVPDVEVLAVGSTTTTQDSSGDGKDAQKSDLQDVSSQTTTSLLVTLAVTQDQAQRVIHAMRTGTMTFALLGVDTQAKLGSGTDDKRLFTGITP